MTRRVLVCFAGLTLVVSAFLWLPGWAQESARQAGKKEIPKTHADPARNEVELLEAQLDVHKAMVDEAATRLKVAKEHLDRLQKVADGGSVTQTALHQARGQVDILQAQLRVKQAEMRVGEVRLKHARQAGKPGHTHDHGKSGHNHGDWWCAEHGVPEEMCSLCSDVAAAKFKKAGDWCRIHDRAKSQCFKCEPSLYKKYEAMFEAKYGKKPPRPPESEFTK